MKIRAGFVSNSSSTSFLLIAADDLNDKDFFALMGIDENSPLVGLFSTLYEAIFDNCRRPISLSDVPIQVPVKDWFTDLRRELTPRMIEKLEEGRRRGWKAYYGGFNSDMTTAECFFCMDSFEVENDRIYFNALECIW